MKLKGTFTYLGIDTFRSQKNNAVYKSACFLQGTDVQKVFLNSETVEMLDGIPKPSNVEIELDIRTGQSTFVSLLSVNVQSVPDVDPQSSNKSQDSDPNKKKIA